MQEGDYVYYTDPVTRKKENGRVKSISGGRAWVVYHCAGNWDKYSEYTGVNTDQIDLSTGWVDESGKLLPEYCDHHYIHTNYKWQPINQQRCCHCGHTIN